MECLKTCPFCGGKIKIEIRDDEGNKRDAEYEKNPYSGLSYTLGHYIEDNKKCPIANFKEDEQGMGVFLYSSKEEAIKNWNKRR